MKSFIEIEEWLDIPGYEGLYQVSNLGRVKSLERYVKHPQGTKSLKKGKSLKQCVVSGGYLAVDLCKNGIIRMYTIHRLVAEAFLPNPDNLPQVNHINECKWDNTVWNLEWCDAKYNINYGTLKQRLSQKQLNQKATSKSVLQYTKEGLIVAEYPSQQEAARQTGVCNVCISNCCRGGQNSAGGYVWKYKD